MHIAHLVLFGYNTYMYGYNVETTAIPIQRVLQYFVIVTLQYEIKILEIREAQTS